jgi:diguanylate cyclase (GGDEF)-like protein
MHAAADAAVPSSPAWLGTLAQMTATRERSALDMALARLLRKVVGPAIGLRLLRTATDAQATPRWLDAWHWPALANEPVVTDPEVAWMQLEALPAVADRPAHAACAGKQEVHKLRSPQGQALCLLPVGGGPAQAAVLEIASAQVLEPGLTDLLQTLLDIHDAQVALLDHAECDTLTGLLNRKTYDEAFLRSAALRPGDVGERGCCVLGVLDIDHFKRVNDRFGHLIGDEVLLLLAQLMRRSFRQQDGLYRFGGEEFVVLMRCRQRGEAALAFERLRATVQAHAFPQVGQVTVSIGMTEVLPGDTPARAFSRADEAVYRAKHEGRNRVCDHDALSASGLAQAQDKVGEVELF